MKLVIQRVQATSIWVENQCVSSIPMGLLVYVGIVQGDQEKDIHIGAKKISGIRIFEDETEKMTLSLPVGEEILLISQFTLCGTLQKGFRPDFIEAEKPPLARLLFDQLRQELEETYHRPVKTGVFGATMQIHSQVDGPVTILFDTRSSK